MLDPASDQELHDRGHILEEGCPCWCRYGIVPDDDPVDHGTHWYTRTWAGFLDELFADRPVDGRGGAMPAGRMDETMEVAR